MIAVSAITLLLILGAIITPFNIVFATKQTDDPNSNSNPPPDQPTNSGDQPPSADGNPPPTADLDCTKTPDDPACQPKSTPPNLDCMANPTDPLCPPPTLKQENTSSAAAAGCSSRWSSPSYYSDTKRP